MGLAHIPGIDYITYTLFYSPPPMKEYPTFPSSIEIVIGFNLSVIAIENHWIKKVA